MQHTDKHKHRDQASALTICVYPFLVWRRRMSETNYTTIIMFAYTQHSPFLHTAILQYSNTSYSAAQHILQHPCIYVNE